MKQIVDQLNAEGFTSYSKARGESPISFRVVQRYVENEAFLKEMLADGVGDVKTSFDKWCDNFLQETLPKARLNTADVIRNYKRWAKTAEGKKAGPALNRIKITKVLMARGYERVRVGHDAYFLGLKIRGFTAGNSPLDQFLQERVRLTGVRTDRVPLRELREKYCEFCLSKRRQPEQASVFGRMLEARGYRVRKVDGVQWVLEVVVKK